MTTKCSLLPEGRVELGFPIVPIIFPFRWLFFSLTPPFGPKIGTPIIFPFLWLRDD